MLDPTSMSLPSPLMMPSMVTIFLAVPLTAFLSSASVLTVTSAGDDEVSGQKKTWARAGDD